MSRPVLAWSIWVVAVALTAAGMVLLALVPADRAPGGSRLIDVLPYTPMPLSLATVGALVAARRPTNAIGWLLLSAGGWHGMQFFMGGYAVFGLFGGLDLPGARLSAWVFAWAGAVGMLPVSAIVYLFPDGRFALYRSRIGFALGAAGTAALGTALAFTPGGLLNLPDVANPYGLPGQEALVVALVGLGLVLSLASMVLMISTVVARYRAAALRERLQFKWFAAGVALAVLLFAVAVSVTLVNWDVAKVIFTTGVSVIPVAIAIAILRHHLYDIDVVANRALVYGATTTLVGVAFFAGIVVLQAVLRPLTGGSEIAVAVSTLASVALAQPARRRIQDAVDRRFYRSRYDAGRTLDTFTDRLAGEVDLESVRLHLLGAVDQTMSPVHASVWLRERAR